MHFNINDVFYLLYSHQNVSVAIAAICRVMLLQEYKYTNVVLEKGGEDQLDRSCEK